MSGRFIRYFFRSNRSPIIVLWIILLVSFFSCSEKKNNFVPSFEDESLVPTMKTVDVEVLASDSGIPQYRVEAKEWLVFDKRKDPYWYFPKGVYGEKFDSIFQPVFYLKSDTAMYYTEKDLWQFDGHVEVKNKEGQVLTTSQLFWDRKIHKFWTFRRFRSEEASGEYMEGMGMHCEEDLSRLVIVQAGPGDFLEIKKDSMKKDSSTVGSLSAGVVDLPVDSVDVSEKRPTN